MYIHSTYRICTECMLLIANGECPDEDGGEARAERIIERVGADVRLHPDYDDEGSFSWAGCDACGSTLGNNLHNATGLCSHPECGRHTVLEALAAIGAAEDDCACPEAHEPGCESVD